jgi:transposase
MQKRLLGVDHTTVIETVEFDEVIAHVQVRNPNADDAARSADSPRPATTTATDPVADERWTRGTIKVFLEAQTPRVACPEHGVTVAWVPWARHDAGFTEAFEEQVAWLAPTPPNQRSKI